MTFYNGKKSISVKKLCHFSFSAFMNSSYYKQRLIPTNNLIYNEWECFHNYGENNFMLHAPKAVLLFRRQTKNRPWSTVTTCSNIHILWYWFTYITTPAHALLWKRHWQKYDLVENRHENPKIDIGRKCRLP